MNSNKDDKHCNNLMIDVWVLLLSSVFLVVFAQSYILVAIALFVTVFSMIVALIYDSKRDKIYQNELNLFIENYRLTLHDKNKTGARKVITRCNEQNQQSTFRRI